MTQAVRRHGDGRQPEFRATSIDCGWLAHGIQLHTMWAAAVLGAVLLHGVAACEQGPIMEVSPLPRRGVVVLRGTVHEARGGTLQFGVVVGVQRELPGGAAAVPAYEPVAGPVVLGQDAPQDPGVDVVDMTATPELDAVQLVTNAS
ncbi:hypothetical protein AQJ11_37690 [Streptomyces corchorusii]|uniref:Uncharacterized protein n=1 Tax=Streptomyces corchorusii TaxID=1903 RepID=A0A101PTV0_STRCK|nr:hypothetical protein AQJ11_37690 [Streptomyces corchorusii]